MSAALQLPTIWATQALIYEWHEAHTETPAEPPAELPAQTSPEQGTDAAERLPEITLAFYRKHTEKMLRRYLYASMLVGRAPSILGETVSRGWVSCRRVRTFEDAVIFVLDIERCLNRLGAFDRAILSRIALQEYTHAETAALLGVSARTVSNKYPMALDRLNCDAAPLRTSDASVFIISLPKMQKGSAFGCSPLQLKQAIRIFATTPSASAPQ